MNSELNYLFKSIGIQSFIDKLQMFHLSQFFPFSLPMDRERSPTHHIHFLAKFQNQNSSLHYPMTYETSLLSHHVPLLAVYCLFMECYAHVNYPIKSQSVVVISKMKLNVFSPFLVFHILF